MPFTFLSNGCSWYETHRLGGCQRREQPRAECQTSSSTVGSSATAHRLAVLVPYRNPAGANVDPSQLNPLCDRLSELLDRHSISFQIFVVNQRDRRRFNRGALANAAVATLTASHDGMLSSLPQFDYVAIHDIDRFPSNLSSCARAGAAYYAYPSHSPRVLHPSSFAGGVLVVRLALLQAVNGLSNSYWGWGEEDNDLFLRLRWCGLPPVHGQRLDECMEHRDCTACKRQKEQLDKAVLHAHEQRMRDRLPHPRVHMLRDGISTLNFTLRRRLHRVACGRGVGRRAGRRPLVTTAIVMDVDLSRAVSP